MPDPSSSTIGPPRGYVVPYPPELVESYRAAGYWGVRTIAEELQATAMRHPDAPAVRTPDGALTYAELDRRTDVVAAGLLDLGLAPGGRVLLQIASCEWAAVAWYSLLKAGLVPICTLPHHRRHELTEIARQAEPVAHLVQADFASHDLVALAREISAEQPSLERVLTIHATSAAPDDTTRLEDLLGGDGVTAPAARSRVADIQAAIDSADLAVLQLSGGTTSVPKLIPRLHAEYWYNSRAWAEQIDLGPGDNVAHLLPLIHNAGVVCALHAAHARGACVSFCAPEAESFLRVAEQAPVTHILMVRPLAQLISASPPLDAALGALRVVIWADKKLTAEARDRYDTANCLVGQMFGMGEGMCLLTPLDASAEVRHHTNGAPLCPMDETRVLQPGTELPAELGEPGELCCRGPYTIRGYYRSPERNREAFTSDGFYRTGDIVVEVEIDGRRWISLEDRLKDLINRGGEKINAAEVEELLVRHPGIAVAALVAMPDERLGERACAFVVPADGRQAPTVEELRDYFEGLGVAKFKWPERVEVRSALPQTNIQKVNKVALRAEIAELCSRDTQTVS